MTRIILTFFVCAAMIPPIWAQGERDREELQYRDSIPAGTVVRVRTDQSIDVRDRTDGRIYTGTVEEDVRNADGQTMIPRGSAAELIVQRLSDENLSVDLESVAVRGRRYMVAAEAYESSRRAGVGKNRRTGEYVGGGALFGTIIGAIAGGGKGAAIGALAGGAAGAGAQVATRGRVLNIPEETVLSFRLEQPLALGRGQFERDNGYDRDGHHYHDDYYRRDRQ